MSGQKRMTAAEFREAQLIEMSEDQLLHDVTELAGKLRWKIHHDRGDYSQCIAGDPGFPDLIMARRAHLIVAELKSVTGKWRPGQKEWLADFAGDTPDDWHFDRWVYAPAGLVACWTPLSWDRIRDELGAK